MTKRTFRSVPPDFQGMTPLLRNAFTVASYRAPLEPKELTIRLAYVLVGAVLSLGLLVTGVVMVYTRAADTQNGRVLSASLTFFGFIGLCLSAVAASVVLCRAYRGLYAENIGAIDESREATDAISLVIHTLESLRDDPSLEECVATAVTSTSMSTSARIVNRIEAKLQENPSIRRLFRHKEGVLSGGGR
jgi:hypothetical protein